MRVHVGPLPSVGVREWIAYARAVIAHRAGPDVDPSHRLTPEVVEGFTVFLDEWEALADESDVFLWDTEVDVEQVEFLALALHKVAVSLAHGPPPPGTSGRPPAGEAFYQAFINAFLDAMEAEGGALASYAQELRADWPDLED